MVGVNIMEKNTRRVNFNQLEEGMIVAKNVEQNGRILLRKDNLITKQMIDKLQTLFFVGVVEVYNKKVEKKKTEADIKKEHQHKIVEQEFNDISFKLQKTFRQIVTEDGIAMNEVREFAKKIQNEINPSSIVLKNIVLYGSGTDSIYRHCVNVAALSAILGNWIGLEKSQINLLVYSGLMHDFGKTKVDRDVLKKEVPLSKNEFSHIKTHANAGYQIIKQIAFLDKSVSYGVLMHHEREDGSGYPLGLKGEAIHKFAKIIAIADVFDAINSDRGYKKKKPPFEALQLVKNEGLGKLNYEYVKIFLEHVIDYYTGEEVLLNTNERCKIIQMNVNNLDRPLVMKNGEFIDLDKEKDLYIKELLI
jgi:HD-GYP domain-containing protein (c-di-GMP phosphodiesterase class II)